MRWWISHTEKRNKKGKTRLCTSKKPFLYSQIKLWACLSQKLQFSTSKWHNWDECCFTFKEVEVLPIRRLIASCSLVNSSQHFAWLEIGFYHLSRDPPYSHPTSLILCPELSSLQVLTPSERVGVQRVGPVWRTGDLMQVGQITVTTEDWCHFWLLRCLFSLSVWWLVSKESSRRHGQ